MQGAFLYTGVGILRTILAIAVVVYHSYKILGLHMTGGQVSVQAFYIISGFYMALVLNEKYTGKGSYRLFVTNRLLRIYPVYWIILGLALLVSLVGYYAFGSPYYLGVYVHNKGCLSPMVLAYFAFENMVLLGQDVLLFLGIDHCQVAFSKYPFAFRQMGFHYLLVPQAWSVSLELMFYALAPFIVRRRWTLQLLMVAAGLLLRYVVSCRFYLSFDPWTYRFFPLELPFFITGSLMYVLYRQLPPLLSVRRVGYTLLIFCILFVFFYDEFAKHAGLKMWLFYLLLAFSLPFIFMAFKNSAIDRWIGELSFSLYICHHLVVMVLHGPFFGHPQYIPYYGYTVLAGSLGLAFIVNKLAVEPLNKRREKRVLARNML